MLFILLFIYVTECKRATIMGFIGWHLQTSLTVDLIKFCLFQFGFRMYQNDMGRNFNQTYRCYSVTMLADREDVERGGKSRF